MIKDLNELKKLLKICRANGVTEIEFGGAKLKLGEMPLDQKGLSAVQSNEIDSDNPYANFPDGELTLQQQIFYSAGGHPDDDPENQKEFGVTA